MLQKNVQQNKIDQLNEELRREVAEYDMLMESTEVCIIKMKMEEGLPVIWCNESTYRTVGYTKEEYQAEFGYDLRSYFSGREASLNMINKALKNALDNGKRRWQVLLQLPKRRGNFWAQCSGTFTDYNSDTGRPTSIYGVFTDVTSVVETQEKLVLADRENDWLNSVLDNIPAGVCVCSLQNDVPISIMLNQYLADKIGVSSGQHEIIDENLILEFIHEDDRDICRTALMVLLEKKDKMDMVCRVRLKDTDCFFWARIEGLLAKPKDNAAIAYLTCTDISELKETERTLQRAVVAAKLLVWEYDIEKHTVYLADNEIVDRYCDKYQLGHVITNVPESVAEFVDEKSRTTLFEMRKEIEAGESASHEICFKRTSRWEPRCERISYTVERDMHGRPNRAYAISADITQEKAIEEQYERERNYLHNNRDNNLVAKGHYNLTQNKILEYSLQNEKTIGVDYFSISAEVPYDEGLKNFLKEAYSDNERKMMELDLNYAARGDAVDLRNRLILALQEEASKHSDKVIMFVDEANLLLEPDYHYLMDIYNRLSMVGTDMLTVLIGTKELLLSRNVFAKIDKQQIINRFMIFDYEFTGIKTPKEIQEILMSYDYKSVYPEGTKMTFTRYFFPDAYDDGERLSNYAKELFEAVEENICFNKGENISIPMKDLTTMIEYVLKTYGVEGESVYWPDISKWKESLNYTGMSNYEQIYGSQNNKKAKATL